MYELAQSGEDALDFRSDTVTRPSPGMWDAMHSAPLGDDIFRDDPTVLEFEAEVATFLGKEAGLFVPSGTMANQIAIRLHTRHGDEVIAHKGAHLYNYESGAQAALAGVAVRTISSADGTLDPQAVQDSMHLSDDPHYAPTGLIAFENTHNQCGGRVVPQENIEAVAQIAQGAGIPMHLDGARLGNAIVASKLPGAELAKHFETISMCFSKGLGAPIGSVLVGSHEKIAQAIRYRKMYGGGMRQAGVLAAAGLFALRHQLDDLERDHQHARLLAGELNTVPGVDVDVAGVHTNLVYFSVDKGHPALANGDRGFLRVMREKGVLLTGGGNRFRAVLHRDLDSADVEKGIGRMRAVLAG